MLFLQIQVIRLFRARTNPYDSKTVIEIVREGVTTAARKTQRLTTFLSR
jgi:hypothetical protein